MSRKILVLVPIIAVLLVCGCLADENTPWPDKYCSKYTNKDMEQKLSEFCQQQGYGLFRVGPGGNYGYCKKLSNDTVFIKYAEYDCEYDQFVFRS